MRAYPGYGNGVNVHEPRVHTPSMALDVLAQRAIDARLVPLIGSRLALEPGHDVGIEPEGQLLLDGPIEEAAPGA
jgi:hypothetical protein